jgi:catechol 2,3-dioxygenase-like lactoylglutathione lyase family enzyme
MRLGYTILYVASVPDTIAFYERAFGLERGFIAEGEVYGEMSTGETKLAFSAEHFARTLTPVPFAAAHSEKAAPPIELGLVTTDVEAAYTRGVAAGAMAVKPPERKPWGQVVAYVRDNNGFLVEICTPMEN